MSIGKITVSQLIAKVNVHFEKILDIHITQKENQNRSRSPLLTVYVPFKEINRHSV